MAPLTSSPVTVRTSPASFCALQVQSLLAGGLGRPWVNPGSSVSWIVTVDVAVEFVGSHWNWAKPWASVTRVLEAGGGCVGSGGRIHRNPPGTVGVVCMLQPGAGVYAALAGVCAILRIVSEGEQRLSTTLRRNWASFLKSVTTATSTWLRLVMLLRSASRASCGPEMS